MDMKLSDKVVVITGASGGIGRAMAEAFAKEGSRVALHGHRHWDELQAWLAEQTWRDRALAVRADITTPSEVRAAFDLVRERWGRVDVAISNAGVWPAENRLLWELSEERMRTVLEVNLLGAVWTAREFAHCLSQTGARPDGHGACMLFTGSTAGHFGESGHADYAISKAALSGLVKSFKNELVNLDPYARVNLVEPGWTVTEMARKTLDEPGVPERIVRTMPLRQIARACDVARAAVFLASPAAARHISGQTLTVAGGMEGRVLWDAVDVDRQRLFARLDDTD